MNILDKIVRDKRQEVDFKKELVSTAQLENTSLSQVLWFPFRSELNPADQVYC